MTRYKSLLVSAICGHIGSIRKDIVGRCRAAMTEAAAHTTKEEARLDRVSSDATREREGIAARLSKATGEVTALKGAMAEKAVRYEKLNIYVYNIQCSDSYVH